MRKFLLMTAALAALPFAAAAQTNTALTSFEFQRFHMSGIAFGPGKFNYEGLRHDMTGRYDMGVQWDSTLRVGDIEGFALRSAEFDVRYLWSGLVGPQASFEYASIGGTSADRIMLGIAGAYSLNHGTSFSGALVSDVDNFGHDARLTLDINHDFGNDVSLFGGVMADRIGGTTARGIHVGARYNLGSNAYISGQVEYDRMRGMSARGASIGVGFNF